jgi:hypothetical protein
LAVIGGIITIAFADALADSFGMFLSVESNNKSKKYTFFVSLTTFFSKLFVSLTFLILILIFDLFFGIIINFIYGLFLIGVISYFIARQEKSNIFRTVFIHLIIAMIVLIIATIIGLIINYFFG